MAEEQVKDSEAKHDFKLGDKLYETPKEREDLAKGEIKEQTVEELKDELKNMDSDAPRRFRSGKWTPNEDMPVIKSEEI